MDTSSSPNPSQSMPEAAPRRERGTFNHLQVVIAVALVVATLYTVWTPAGLPQPVAPSGTINKSERQPTPLPAGFPTSTPRVRPLVGIVVGHWEDDEKDPGAVCPDGFTELMVNQNVATKVKEYLTAENIDVDLLKEFDERLYSYEASALVSIHADSCGYIIGEPSGYKVAAALHNPHPERSTRLTSCLRSRYGQATGLPVHSTSITEDMTSYHAFDEIFENTSAAIIEVGFLGHFKDREILEKRPEVAARGVADGILCFLRNESISTPTGEAQPTPTTAP